MAAPLLKKSIGGKSTQKAPSPSPLVLVSGIWEGAVVELRPGEGQNPSCLHSKKTRADGWREFFSADTPPLRSRKIISIGRGRCIDKLILFSVTADKKSRVVDNETQKCVMKF
jgi:hypothetical protein